MPAFLQKAIDLTLTNCKNTYAYLDDILIITEGSVEKHMETLEKVLRRLDEENFAISLDKCKFACKQIEWLGFHIDCEGTTPLSRKTDAIEKLLPKRLINLKVSWDQYTILQGTSHIWHIKKTDKQKTLNLSAEHDSAFLKIKKLVTEITQIKHFDQNLDTRVVCDASTYGLGAVLEQNTKEG